MSGFSFRTLQRRNEVIDDAERRCPHGLRSFTELHLGSVHHRSTFQQRNAVVIAITTVQEIRGALPRRRRLLSKQTGKTLNVAVLGELFQMVNEVSPRSERHRSGGELHNQGFGSEGGKTPRPSLRVESASVEHGCRWSEGGSVVGGQPQSDNG